MSEIIYPSSFERRVLSREAPGGAAASLEAAIPSVIAAGQPFRVKLAVLDSLGYPSLEFGDSLCLQAEGCEPSEVRVPFHRGEPAVAAVCGFRTAAGSMIRLRADWNGSQSWSNPGYCEESPAEQLVWGDPHVHTVLSNCHADRCRSLTFCFVAARHLTGLDWVAAADHVSNGRCELARWKEQAATADAYDDPPEFVTLPAYEASLKGGAGGDNNVYLLRFPELFVDEYETGNLRTLCEKLNRILPAADFLIVPHHTTRPGKHGEISEGIYPGSRTMPLVEVHSKWGTSEYRGNPNPLKQVHPGPSYAVDLLNRGLQLGFIAGTDTHATMPSGGGAEPSHIDRFPGLTAVRVRDLTREQVFRGLQRRHCYATSRDRIYLDGTVAGLAFGESQAERDPSTPREISLRVAARSRLTAVEIVRNGQPLCCVQPDGWHAEVHHTDSEPLSEISLESPAQGPFAYYYARVTCESGAQAWSSPVWLFLGKP